MRSPAKTFCDLVVWQKAHEFVLAVYPFIGAFPRKEMFCLSSQFCRAAISIPANIAEGFAKWSSADKVRFLNIAQGSLEECRYYLILSEDLGYGKTQELARKLEDLSFAHGLRECYQEPQRRPLDFLTS
jgi:four helix bundle protein